ncbi:MAG: tetratricopeptide repeat protein [Candidatus Dependentiae bacterium]|jgi:tetratricopeptide (TPR) repeat protein
MQHSRLSRITTSISLLFVTFLAYFPSLFYPFNFDDIANITRNFNIRTFDVWHKMLTYRRWFGEWLNALVFRIDGFNPTYYRLCNIAIHILTGLMVLLLINRLLKLLPKESTSHRYRWPIAALTSTLFLLHPVQTQTISYVIQGKLEGCASLLMLASFYLLLHVITSQSKLTRNLSLTGALLFSAVACGSKEITIMAPLLFLLIDWFFVAQQQWSELKKRWWLHALYSGVVFGIMLHYFGRHYIAKVFSLNTAIPNNRGNILTSHATERIAPLPFLISQPKVLLHYLWMFIWPLSICVEYGWKLTRSLLSLEFIVPSILLGLLSFAVLRRSVRTQTPVLSFGLLWFFITMAPRTSIIPSSELVVDYKTYLASMGWLLVLSYSIVAIVRWMSTQDISRPASRNHNSGHRIKSGETLISQLYYPALCSFTFMLSIGTYHRNQVWSSGRAFWHDVITNAPENARGYNNYGVEILKEADMLAENKTTQPQALAIYKEAVTAYKKAIALDPYYPDPYSNASVVYAKLNQHEEAAKVAKKAIRMMPEYPEAHNNLGGIYIALHKYNEAEEALKKAIALRPHYGKAYFNLARLNLDLQRHEDAIAMLQKATEGDFDRNPECYHAMGQLNMQIRKYDDAIAAFEKLASLHRGENSEQETASYFSLANALHCNREHEKAHTLYLQLAHQHPERNQYWHNLAENLFQQGKIAEAEKYFARATEKGEGLLQSHLRLAECREKNGDTNKAIEIIDTILKADVDHRLPAPLRQKCHDDIRRMRTKVLVG